MGTGTITIKGTAVSQHSLQILLVSSLAVWTGSIGFWYAVNSSAVFQSQSLTITTTIIASILTFTILSIRFHFTWKQWIHLWIYTTPWLLTSMILIPQLPTIPILSAIIPTWLLIAIWGIYRFVPFDHLDTRLHRAKFANLDEKQTLSSKHPHEASLLLGVNMLSYWFPKYHKQFYCVRSKPSKKELGNMLINAPTRSGKGLHAVSQLLTWKYSVVVNDPKGELFHQTGGLRAILGKVLVIDVTGVGNRFDPLDGKYTRHQLLSAAKQLLHIPNEKDPIFTKRATNMLTQLFLAARKANHPPFPFVMELVQKGLPDAAAIVNDISPDIATGLLYKSFKQADFSDKFLNSSWDTLATIMNELVTDEILKILSGSDFDPAELMLSEKPVSLYLKWKEEDLLVLAPMIRLTWNNVSSV